MANYNKVLLIGNLTRDPELRYTPSGRGQDGESRDETCFVDITAWGRQAEVINEYCRRGRAIFVEGRLQLDSWQTQDGQRRSKLKVVLEGFQFLGARGDASRENASGRPASRPERAPEAPAEEGEGFSPGDDDIPF